MVSWLALAACTEDEPPTVIDYTLRLTPVVPFNEAPFADLDRVQLVLQPEAGEPTTVDLGAPASGSTPVAEDLPPLDGTVVYVLGERDGEVVTWGRSEPLTLESGSAETTVFVAEADAAAWLGQLDEPRAGAMLAALGDGRFLVAGGMAEGPGGTLSLGYDTIGILDLAPPDPGLAFTSLGTLPTYVDAWDFEQLRARVGATLTPIGGGPDAGRFLLVGGSTGRGVDAPDDITADAATFDPEAAVFTALEADAALEVPRANHVAIANAQGAVIVAGGWSIPADPKDPFGWTGSIEAWDPATGAFLPPQTDPMLAAIDLAAVDLGVDGVAFCGGAELDLTEGGRWRSSAHCTRVGLDLVAEPASDLPAALAGSAMVSLPDGRILLTGGAIQTSRVGLFDLPGPAAVANAWVTEDFETWQALSSMNLPRAGHRMVVLPDGRVVVAGGAPSYSPVRVPEAAYSCVEVFDPGSNRFTLTESCSIDDAAVGLAGRAWQPELVVDPEFGALAVGGANRTEEGEVASSEVTLIVPRF